MNADAVMSWPLPPPDGFVADDLDRLVDLPPHTELIDGSLVFVSPQKVFHALALDLLLVRLRQAAPPALRVRREMSIVIGPRQRPEPDIVVIEAEAETGPQQTSYPAEAVKLAVEIVSPDSEVRDRERKPQLYAGAGIKHFWRVENDGAGNAVVYVYELDPATRAYGLTGIFHGPMRLNTPFDVDIDLTDIGLL
jgi:Uma2 family endonuclease